jgi:threonine dehydrogenase-like Zn-dependent dehydrogenase
VLNRKGSIPGLLVVTDINQVRLDRAALLFPPADAARRGIKLIYLNTGATDNPVQDMLKITGGKGYDDVFVFAPVAAVIEQGDALLGFDGCLNFFAGPDNPQFKAMMNFYNVHYNYTHIVGTSGGNRDDMTEGLKLISKGLDPAGLVTHIGGLDAVIETTKHLPEIPGGKKLMYTNISMPLTAIDDFEVLGKTNPFFSTLAQLTSKSKGLWNTEAEDFLLKNARSI